MRKQIDTIIWTVVASSLSLLLAACMTTGTVTCVQDRQGNWECTAGAQGTALQSPVATPGL